MNILLNIWYVFSALIGCVLALVSCLLLLFGSMLAICSSICSIKDREWDDFKFIGIVVLITIVFCSATYGINYIVTKDNYIVSEEIQNIQAYDGVGSEKINNKQTGDFYYFEQGMDNSYTEYKVEQRKAIKHYTDGKIKVIKNHKEYTSPFRFFGILFVLQDEEYYDIYIPKEK